MLLYWRKDVFHKLYRLYDSHAIITIVCTFSDILEMAGDMKKSNDPCYDFYEYSCGSYIDKYLPNRLTSSIVLNDKFSSLLKDNLIRAKDIIEGMGNTNDPVFKKAYTYYKACMSGSRSLSPYFTAADKIGGSHITTIGPFDYSKWNLEDALKTMKLLYNANPLFKIHVSHDLFNASRNIFTVSRYEQIPIIIDLLSIWCRQSLGDLLLNQSLNRFIYVC